MATMTGRKYSADSGMIRWAQNRRDQIGSAGVQIRLPLAVDYLLVTHLHIDHIGRIPKSCSRWL